MTPPFDCNLMNMVQKTGHFTSTDGRAYEYRVSWSADCDILLCWAAGLGGTYLEYTPMVQGLVDRGIAVAQVNFRDSGVRPPRIDVLHRVNLFRDFIDRRIEYLPYELYQVAVAAGGHSAGAMTAQAVSGATYIDDEGLVISNEKTYVPAIRALVALSPQGVGEASNTTPETWETLRVPPLYGTGRYDDGGFGEDEVFPYTWRLEPFYEGAAIPRASYVLRHGDHSHGGLTGRSAYIPSQAEPVLDMMTSWLRWHCRSDMFDALAWRFRVAFPARAFETVLFKDDEEEGYDRAD